MARFQFDPGEESGGGPISARMITELPEVVRSTLKTGFGLLSRVAPERYSELMVALREAIATRNLGGESERIAKLGISPAEVGPLLSAGTFAMAVLQERREENAAGQLIRIGQDSGVIAEGDAPKVLAFMELVARDRAEVAETFEQVSLASAVLPSISSVGVAIDVRLRFDKDDNVVRVVPVAVLHIDTDTTSELWAQASVAQLEAMAQKLERAVRHLKLADAKFAKPQKQA